MLKNIKMILNFVIKINVATMFSFQKETHKEIFKKDLNFLSKFTEHFPKINNIKNTRCSFVPKQQKKSLVGVV